MRLWCGRWCRHRSNTRWKSSAACILPFRFRGDAVVLLRCGRKPIDEDLRFVVGDVRHRNSGLRRDGRGGVCRRRGGSEAAEPALRGSSRNGSGGKRAGRLEVFRGEDGEDADGERCRKVDTPLRHLVRRAIRVVAGRTDEERSPGHDAHYRHLIAIAKHRAWRSRRIDERAVVDGVARRQRSDGVAVDVGRSCNQAGGQVGIARFGRSEIRDPGEELAPLPVFAVALPPGKVYGLVEREGDGDGAGLDENRNELSAVLAVMGFGAYPVRGDGPR